MIGRISEIFSSVQGEGIRAREHMVFVRFTGCNLSCDYCDTPHSRYIIAGTIFTLEEVIAEIETHLAKNRKISTIAFTGGEPLLHSGLIAEIIRHFKKKGIKTYIDTNGTLCEKFRLIADDVECVAMDIKLPSANGGKEFWDLHREFLNIAQKNIFVKVVLTENTTLEEFKKAIDMVEGINKSIPTVLQPSTPVKDVGTVSPELLDSFHKIAKQKLKNIYVIPQMHRKWGVK